MIYKSIEDLRNLSITEIEDFLKRYWKTRDLVFYGVFIPNTENPENYSGTMTKVKVPGSTLYPRYPFTDIGSVTFKLPSNQRLTGRFYKFNCRLLPNFNNPCQLQILLSTLEEIDQRTYQFIGYVNNPRPHAAEDDGRRLSPIVYRYKLLEDNQTGWGNDITHLIGLYKEDRDGNYFIDDIRRADLTRLTTYPKTTFRVGPFRLHAPIEGLTEGQYCRFYWRFTFNEKVNPCEIEVDESRPITPIPPEELLTAISQRDAATYLSAEGATAPEDPTILIYDLLTEANKFSDTPVDVQFTLTDNYLLFHHTGRPLTAENMLDYCGLREQYGEGQERLTAYHCQGLRQFLLHNAHSIVISNGFFINFNVVNGRLIPQWQDYAALPREVKISLARSKRFTETIILPFSSDDMTVMNNYRASLLCVFEDVDNIAFYQNIGKVTVKIKGRKAKTLDRNDWFVSKEYVSFIPKQLRDRMKAKEEVNTNERSQPMQKKLTSIMFACRHKDNELLGVKDAPVYCMIPTTTSFGFPFLMNMDIDINKTNYAISRRSAWNRTYAEIAGRLFGKWIADLAKKKEFTSKSILSIVPKFEACLASHPDDRKFIELFQKGFKDVIMNEPDKQSKTRFTGQSSKGKVYVIDTNVFVNCPDIIAKIGSGNTVILSAKVIDELDNLKYKLEDKELRNVQKALKNINQEIDKGNVVTEMSDIKLLPRDFDRHNPDNNILSVVLRHKAESPTLLSSDNGLQIKSKALGINVIGLKDFNKQ